MTRFRDNVCMDGRDIREHDVVLVVSPPELRERGYRICPLITHISGMYVQWCSYRYGPMGQMDNWCSFIARSVE